MPSFGKIGDHSQFDRLVSDDLLGDVGIIREEREDQPFIGGKVEVRPTGTPMSGVNPSR